jgi:glycosyltransferase involved in cell wall biosynthesis
MKILYLNNLYDPYVKGGAEISLQLLVEGMKTRGHEVVVLSYSPNPGLQVDEVNGVKVYRAELQNHYWPYDDQRSSASRRLLWHLRDIGNAAMGKILDDVLTVEKPDIVSCHNLAGWSVAVWKVIRNHKIPVIQVLHDLYLMCANSNMYKNDQVCLQRCFSCKMLRMTHPVQSSQVNAVVGISRSILNTFTAAGYFNKAEKYVIHNTRQVPDIHQPRIRKPGQPLKVGYLGTLSKIKGVEWLIQEFRNLEIDGSLLMAGKGHANYEQGLRKMSNDSRVSWLGQVNSSEFLGQIDILVVPSLWEEPLGMVAIEALAHHVPVIANKSGGLKETVQEEINGLFCQADLPESLGTAIERLYQDADLYNKLSSAARQSVQNILDKDRMLNAYELAMKNVIRK